MDSVGYENLPISIIKAKWKLINGGKMEEKHYTYIQELQEEGKALLFFIWSSLQMGWFKMWLALPI